jgi:hypothetical protein
LKGYLRDNADGLVDYRLQLPLTEEERRKLPSLGTVEGNIDKILARRFKRRGMSWSKDGARRLTNLGTEGEILNYGLPALSGPHADRPWVQVLRTLTSQQGIS